MLDMLEIELNLTIFQLFFFSEFTFHKANNECADQTTRMRKLVCALVVYARIQKVLSEGVKL